MNLMGGGTDEQMKKVKKKRVAGKPKMGHTCCTLLTEFMESTARLSSPLKVRKCKYLTFSDRLKTSNCKFQENSYDVPELTGSLNHRRLKNKLHRVPGECL